MRAAAARRHSAEAAPSGARAAKRKRGEESRAGSTAPRGRRCSHGCLPNGNGRAAKARVCARGRDGHAPLAVLLTLPLAPPLLLQQPADGAAHARHLDHFLPRRCDDHLVGQLLLLLPLLPQLLEEVLDGAGVVLEQCSQKLLGTCREWRDAN